MIHLRGSSPVRRFAACLCLAAFLLAGGGAFGGDTLRPRCLTTDLGDPAAPNNLLLEMPLSGEFSAADAFGVHIVPPGREAAPAPEDRAEGVYAWRHGETVWLDVRKPPTRSGSGTYRVVVEARAGGRLLARGVAAESVRYQHGQVDVVLVIDSSQSMRLTDPDRRRIEAARAFLAVAARGRRVGRVAIISFNSRPYVWARLTPLAETRHLEEALDRVEADGATNLDQALAAAASVLERGGSRRGAIVFLTDGRNEPGRYENTHRDLAVRDVPVYAVGLSDEADHEVLERMARETGGRAFRAASDRDLMAVYQRIAAHLSRPVVLLSAEGEGLRGGRPLTVPVDPSVRSFSLVLDAEVAGGRITLQDPEGQPAGGGRPGRTGYVSLSEEEGYQIAHVSRPAAGAWRVRVPPAAGHLTVTAETDLLLQLLPPRLEGRRLVLAATLARGETPLPSAHVRVQPEGDAPCPPFRLYDDGAHGDGEAGDGVYAGAVDCPPGVAGRLDLVARAMGRTPAGAGYQRQAETIVREIPAVRRVKRPVMPEPEIAADLRAGRLDFGVALPGTTARAATGIIFVADGADRIRVHPEALKAADGTALPAEALKLEPGAGERLSPGRSRLVARIDLPDGSAPGVYRGALRLQAGGAEARVPVAIEVPRVALNVTGDALDFGSVPPGTGAVRVLRAGLDAPEPLSLAWRVEASAGEALTVEADEGRLEPGPDNRLVVRLEIPEAESPGVRSGRLVLEAGGARRILPVRWTVSRPPPAAVSAFEVATEGALPPARPTRRPVPAPVAVSGWEVADAESLPPPPDPAPSAGVSEEPPAGALSAAEGVAGPQGETDGQSMRAALGGEALPGPEEGAAATVRDDGAEAMAAWSARRTFWLLVCLVALCICVLLAILVRLFVRQRMARFALASLLLHAIVILIVANIFLVAAPEIVLAPKPALVARLVLQAPDADARPGALRSLPSPDQTALPEPSRRVMAEARRPVVLREEEAAPQPGTRRTPPPRAGIRAVSLDASASRMDRNRARRTPETRSRPETELARRRSRPERRPDESVLADSAETNRTRPADAEPSPREDGARGSLIVRAEEPAPRLHRREETGRLSREAAHLGSAAPVLRREGLPSNAESPRELPPVRARRPGARPLAAPSMAKADLSDVPNRPRNPAEARTGPEAPGPAATITAPRAESRVSQRVHAPSPASSSPADLAAETPRLLAVPVPGAEGDVQASLAERSGRIAGPESRRRSRPERPDRTAIAAAGGQEARGGAADSRGQPEAGADRPLPETALAVMAMMPAEMPPAPTPSRGARARAGATEAFLGDPGSVQALRRFGPEGAPGTTGGARTLRFSSKSPAELRRTGALHAAPRRKPTTARGNSPLQPLPDAAADTRAATELARVSERSGRDLLLALPEADPIARAKPDALGGSVRPAHLEAARNEAGLRPHPFFPEQTLRAPETLHRVRRRRARLPEESAEALPKRSGGAASYLPARLPRSFERDEPGRAVVGAEWSLVAALPPGRPEMVRAGFGMPGRGIERLRRTNAVPHDDIVARTASLRSAHDLRPWSREHGTPRPTRSPREALAGAARSSALTAETTRAGADGEATLSAHAGGERGVLGGLPRALAGGGAVRPDGHTGRVGEREIALAPGPSGRSSRRPELTLPRRGGDERKSQVLGRRDSLGTDANLEGLGWTIGMLPPAGQERSPEAGAVIGRLGGGQNSVAVRRVRAEADALAACQLAVLAAESPLAWSPGTEAALRDFLGGGGTLLILATGPDARREATERSLRRSVRDLTGADLEPLPPSHPLSRRLRRGEGALGGARWTGVLQNGRPLVLHLDDPRLGRELEAILQGRAGSAEGGALAASVLRETLGGGLPEATDVSRGAETDRPTRRPRPVRPAAAAADRSGAAARAAGRAGAPGAESSRPAGTPAGDSTVAGRRMIESFDTLEAGPSAWAAEAWGNPADVWLAPDGAGGQALRVDMQPGASGRVAIRYLPPASRGRRLDLSGASSLVLDVYNGHDRPFDMSVVLTTYDRSLGWRDFESRPVRLRPGWNRMLRFGLRGAVFRSRETGWQNFDSPLANSSLCGKLGVFLYNGPMPETTPVLIDNVGVAF